MAETFDFTALRLRFRASGAMHFPPGSAGNRFRGALGKNLKALSSAAYDRWFAPVSVEGPSGLRQRPRPFVLRVAHLDGAVIPAGSVFCAGVNIFDPQAVDDLSGAMARFASLESAEHSAVTVPFEPQPTMRLRVRFVTPTELKGATRPEFGVLWARIRDRISTLRALYGPGALRIDFKAMAEGAGAIRMTRCDIEPVSAERVSRSTGQRHSLGGFIGAAEYAGALAEFVPYLEIARHTGVGRQTVWGKGEIAVETF